MRLLGDILGIVSVLALLAASWVLPGIPVWQHTVATVFVVGLVVVAGLAAEQDGEA